MTISFFDSLHVLFRKTIKVIMFIIWVACLLVAFDMFVKGIFQTNESFLLYSAILFFVSLILKFIF